MTTQPKRILPLLLVTALVLIPACSPTKKLFKKTDPYQRIQLILDQHKSFDRLESKVNINFKTSQSSNSLAAQVRIQKDSCLWISLQPFLGIEVGRLLLTTDSVFVMNRLQKSYALAALSEQNIGNDQAVYALRALTSVLSNQFFVPGNKKISAKDFDLQEIDKELVMSSSYKGDKAIFYINTEGEYHHARLESSLLNFPLIVDYSLFQSTTFGSFPSRVVLSFQEGNEETELRLDYLRPAYNTMLSFDFPLPGNYKQTSLESILNQLQF